MGKGRQPAQSNVSMGLPDYVDPYFKRLLKVLKRLQCLSTPRLVSLLRPLW